MRCRATMCHGVSALNSTASFGVPKQIEALLLDVGYSRSSSAAVVRGAYGQAAAAAVPPGPTTEEHLLPTFAKSVYVAAPGVTTVRLTPWSIA